MSTGIDPIRIFIYFDASLETAIFLFIGAMTFAFVGYLVGRIR